MRLRLSHGYLVVVCLTLTACTDDDGSPVTSADSGVDGDADIGVSGDATSDADVGPVSDTGLATDAVETDAQDTGALAPEATLVIDGYAAEGVAEPLRVESSGEIATVEWQFGSRDVENTVSQTTEISVTYARRGRYTLNAMVRFADGTSRTISGRLTVVPETLWQQNHSSTVAVSANDERVAVVSPDSDEVAVFVRDGNALAEPLRLATCDNPRTVTFVDDSTVAVVCQDSDAVWVLPVDGTGASRVEVTLPWGARPFGIISVGDSLWVTGQGRGELYEVSASNGELLRAISVGDDARALAALPDGTLAVSRWRADDEVSLVYLVDPTTESVDTMVIEADRQLSSDTETPGVINYLGPVVVSPWGDRAAITGTQANIFQGLFRNGEPLSHETTQRAVVAQIDLSTRTEVEGTRKLFDNRGFAATAWWATQGDFLYVPSRDARSVERLDRFTGLGQSGSLLNVGYAPESVQVSRDGQLVYVDSYLSRELVVFAADAFVTNSAALQRLRIPTVEPLSEPELRGKQLFNDSFDVRLNRDSYIACAGCHLDGESDHLTWDFSERGEGFRNTTSLLGRAGMGHGPVHWSANFDEIQDFEHDIRGPFAGEGLMSDADFFSGGRDTSLGAPKAGFSADLDALAAYVSSLIDYPRSPWRQADGSLTPDAEAGRALFESPELGCTNCHSGEHLTDSRFVAPGEPLLHDVGTLRESSGQRLGGILPGIDTPTLYELYNSWPYLHDGSATSLREVLTTRNTADQHGVTSQLTDVELGQLEMWLLSLDGSDE